MALIEFSIGPPGADVPRTLAGVEGGPGDGLTRTRLHRRTTRSLPHDSPRLYCALGAVAFVVAGAFWLMWRADFGSASGRRGAVYAVVGHFLVVVPALTGLFVVLSGLRMAISRRRRARLRRLYPDQAWRADHPWRVGGAKDRGLGRLGTQLAILATAAVIVTPLNLILAAHADAIWLWALCAVADLIAAWMFVGVLMQLAHAARYGSATVRWDAAPFFVGDDASLGFSLSRPRSFDKLRFTFRAIEEEIAVRGTHDGTETSIEVFCVHEDVREFADVASHVTAGAELHLEFALPERAPATRLSGYPATYWELEVHGTARGLDYRSTCLVPVYERCASVDAAD